ncbi:MAG: deoxyuridine 5'-triphosphate nucleotidohydrolase [Deltaproteobacteria bacterium RBG_13_65_10]|nr:MAG: deoxyuridine 5'-triphosphate nucleotidohydrolase [Deltaproteobacteria bacterium RBG_13_65_10]
MEQIEVPIRRVRPERDADIALPQAMTPLSAGVDLPAAIEEDVSLAPGERRAIPTGFAIALPSGYEGQVRPRSGLALRSGITVANAPGTVDADYRGEVQVILINLGEAPVTIRRGDRVAQLIVAPIVRPDWIEVDGLPESRRGGGGFGHTGPHSPVARQSSVGEAPDPTGSGGRQES